MTHPHRDNSHPPGLLASLDFQKLSGERDNSDEALPSTGTIDDDDNPNDESDTENEAPERGKEDTELPEEFETDDEDDLGHP